VNDDVLGTEIWQREAQRDRIQRTWCAAKSSEKYLSVSATACFKLAPVSIKAQLFGLAFVRSWGTGELVNDRHDRFHQFEESAERLLRGTRRALFGLQFGEGLLHASLVRSFVYAHGHMLSNQQQDANSARFTVPVTGSVERHRLAALFTAVRISSTVICPFPVRWPASRS